MIWVFLLPAAILGILGYSDLRTGTVPVWGILLFMAASIITTVLTIGAVLNIIGTGIFIMAVILSGASLIIILFNKYLKADQVTFLSAFCAYNPFFFLNAVLLIMINAILSIWHEKEFPALWRFFIASLIASVVLVFAF